jgi:hypothetical protein
MIDDYLLSIARAYIDLVNDMRSGRYTTEEVRQLDSDRQWHHNELIRLTGLDPADDMVAHCRRLLHIARSSGQ